MATVTLQDLIKDVAHQLLELEEGTTSAASGSASTFVDTRFSVSDSYVDDEWNGSEVVFEEPAATVSGHNSPGPHTITNFVASSGTFTSNLPFRASGVVASGLNYFLLRPRGQGTPYRGYLAALRWAMDKLNLRTDETDSSLVTVANDWQYAVPAGMGWVYNVVLAKAGFYPVTLMPNQWKLLPGRLLEFSPDIDVGVGATVHLYGYAEDALPATLDGTVDVPREDVVDLAVEYIQRNRTSAPDNARADRRQQERLRFNRYSSPANLRRVIS